MEDDQMLRIKALELALASERVEIVEAESVVTAAERYYKFLSAKPSAS
jgi:hypothetical protein